MNELDHWQFNVGLYVDEHLRSFEPVPRMQGDATHLAIILIGMPSIDQRSRHYP